jgi:hypothetical protein
VSNVGIGPKSLSASGINSSHEGTSSWVATLVAPVTTRRYGSPLTDRLPNAFQRNLCHTWKRISSQTPVIRRGPGSPAVMQGRSPAGGR